jgi:hypothetical protein
VSALLMAAACREQLGDKEAGPRQVPRGPAVQVGQADWGVFIITQIDDPAWQPIAELVDVNTSELQAGQVCHWKQVCFTQVPRLADLIITIHWGQGEVEPLCLLSNLTPVQKPHLVYEGRFWIETLFGSCKSRGFGLARTHLTDPEHIDSLVLAIAIAAYMALGLGTHLALSRQTARVDRADRPDLSLFQIGWRGLHRLLALDRLVDFKMVFSRPFALPKPGFHPAT